MFAAILFDLDNTLIDRNAALERYVRSSFCDPSKICSLIELDCGGQGDRAAFFSLWSLLSGESLDMTNFGRRLSEFVEWDERLLEGLKNLARHVPIGIISNGGVTTQTAKWQAAGLDQVVPRNCYWISEEIGIEKPDPSIFVFASHQLGVEPSECLFVGDQPEIDIAGAQSAGLAAKCVTGPNDVAKLLRIWTLNFEEAKHLPTSRSTP